MTSICVLKQSRQYFSCATFDEQSVEFLLPARQRFVGGNFAKPKLPPDWQQLPCPWPAHSFQCQNKVSTGEQNAKKKFRHSHTKISQQGIPILLNIKNHFHHPVFVCYIFALEIRRPGFACNVFWISGFIGDLTLLICLYHFGIS